MDKDYWRLKKREQRAKSKLGHKIGQKEELDSEVGGQFCPICGGEEEHKVGCWQAWDKEKYPVKAAWEVAVERVRRAKRYAARMPEFVRSGDMKYQDVGWQYENEGLKAVKKPSTMVLK